MVKAAILPSWLDEKEKKMKSLQWCISAALVLGVVSVAGADSIVLSPDPCFLDIGAGVSVEYTHYEPSYFDPCITDPAVHKGWAEVTAWNSGTQPWGDFHFNISGATHVYFDENVAPISDKTLSNVVYNNVDVGASLDLYFYNDWVMPGESAYFKVWTDNTANLNAFFGLCMYPTPVPEPSLLVTLGLGGILIRRKRS